MSLKDFQATNKCQCNFLSMTGSDFLASNEVFLKQKILYHLTKNYFANYKKSLSTRHLQTATFSLSNSYLPFLFHSLRPVRKFDVRLSEHFQLHVRPDEAVQRGRECRQVQVGRHVHRHSQGAYCQVPSLQSRYE